MQLHSHSQGENLKHGTQWKNLKHGRHSTEAALTSELEKGQVGEATHQSPQVVKSPLKDMISPPARVRNMVGMYNGKTYSQAKS